MLFCVFFVGTQDFVSFDQISTMKYTACCRLSAVDSIYNINSYLILSAQIRHHN